MLHIPTTATAGEKLKRAAKSLRDANSCSLAHALELTAQQAGYTTWKHVTQCALSTTPRPSPLLPGRHRHSLTWLVLNGHDRLKQVHSVQELCEALGGIQPYFIRQPCEHAPSGGHCLCELDPFATAMQASIGLDIGDKHDFWNLLFDETRGPSEVPGWQKRVYVGLGTTDSYPNEHLTSHGHRDRSNVHNPNNPAHVANVDNRSMQLNPKDSRFGGVSRLDAD